MPSSALGRAVGFAGLGLGLAYGAAKDSVTGMLRGGDQPARSGLSEENAERLASALCRMRGAALKIGQMLSIQDDSMLPPAFQAALERVRAGADIMPRRQLDQVHFVWMRWLWEGGTVGEGGGGIAACQGPDMRSASSLAHPLGIHPAAACSLRSFHMPTTHARMHASPGKPSTAHAPPFLFH